MIKCSQRDCHFWEEADTKETSFFFPKGVCTAKDVVLADAPGALWLVCRTKIGRQWIPDEPKKPDHVCGKQGFGIGPDGWKDICQACEEDKRERGF